MKKMTLAVVMAMLAVMTFAQKNYKKSVSILGDSYSTFQGYIEPNSNEPWYFADHRQKDNDVTTVDQTWWHQLITKNDWKLCMNNSYSGSTISSSGYGHQDYTARSFVTRMNNLGNPDIIFIFGATNDSWVPSPIGEYKWSKWTEDDLKTVRPSLAKMLDYMTNRYIGVEIYFILNSELKDEINESVTKVCEHYKVPVIYLHDIDKKAGHPSVKGMKAIAKQVEEFVKKSSKKKK